MADWEKVSVGFPGLEKSPFSQFSPALEPRFTLRGADVRGSSGKGRPPYR